MCAHMFGHTINRQFSTILKHINKQIETFSLNALAIESHLLLTIQLRGRLIHKRIKHEMPFYDRIHTATFNGICHMTFIRNLILSPPSQFSAVLTTSVLAAIKWLPSRQTNEQTNANNKKNAQAQWITLKRFNVLKSNAVWTVTYGLMDKSVAVCVSLSFAACTAYYSSGTTV